MARPRNDRANAESRTRLLEAGLASFRARSFAETGISDILQRASVPKGSFYHYFLTKTDFGLAVADHYHDGQIAAARAFLNYISTEALSWPHFMTDRPQQVIRHKRMGNVPDERAFQKYMMTAKSDQFFIRQEWQGKH